MNIAISGFGRIGRTFLRALLADARASQKLRVVAINIGPAAVDLIAHMFKYDSLMGIYPGSVSVKGDELHIDHHRIALVRELDPAQLPWKKYNIDWVVESSGKFTKRDGAQKHLQAGAQAVLITAPAKDEDITIVPGVNEKLFNADKHHIVSLGSCTTNAFVTMLKVIHDTFGIERGFMTTVHAYTNSQVLLDVETSDPRRSRAAAINIIPTSTGASGVVGKVIPELQGKLQASALRVPVAKVSLIDLTVITQKKVSAESMNGAFARAAQESMKGIVAITQEPLVSSDFNGNNHSVVIDGLLTATSGDTTAKLFGWYDNEWGYSVRLKDFLLYVAR